MKTRLSALNKKFCLIHCNQKIVKGEKDLADRKILRYSSKYRKINLADI
jgi:hypothetical protein